MPASEGKLAELFAVERGEQGVGVGGPAGQVPQPGGQLRRVLLGPPQQERALPPDDLGPVPAQVGRPKPGPLPQLRQPQRGHRLAQRGPVGGGTALRGDDGDLPVAVPRQGAGVARLVLPGLAAQQPVGQLVRAVHVHQVPGRHHPRQRDPDGALRDAEQRADAHQAPGAQPGRVQAQQGAENDRTGGQRSQTQGVRHLGVDTTRGRPAAEGGGPGMSDRSARTGQATVTLQNAFSPRPGFRSLAA